MNRLSVSYGVSACFAVLALLCGIAKAETLRQAIARTVAENPEVTAVGHLRRAAGQEVNQARAGYLPKVDVSASYGRAYTENVAPFPRSNTLNERRFSATAREMLFDGFYTHNKLYAAKAKANSESYLQQGTAEDFALTAAQVYLAVLRDQKLVAMAKDRLDTYQEIYDMIKQRGESGLGRRADTNQALTRLEAARADYLTAQNNLLDDIASYRRVIGTKPVDLTEPPVPSAVKLPPSEQTLIERSLAYNPIVKSAVQDIADANGQRAAATSQWLSPKLDLVLGADLNHNINGLPGRNDDAYILGEVSYALFNGGSDFAETKRTAALLNEAQDIRDKTLRETTEKAKLAWNAYRNTQLLKKPLTLRRDEAKATVDAYQTQFRLGKRTLVDLLNAEGDYFDAQNAYIQNEYNYKLSTYRLLNSENRLLKFFAVPFPATSLQFYRISE